MKPSPTLPSESAALVAFGAHPDDIEFGCGGVIARESQQGRPVHIVVCSRGEAGSNGSPDERTLEAEAAARILGGSIEFVDFDGDAHIERKPLHAIALAAILRRRRPKIVLAPTVVENQHPDHAAVGALVRDATRLARYGGLAELKDLPPHAIGQLLYYAVGADAEPAGRLPLLIDVSLAVETWTAAMRAHKSQMKTRDYVDLQLARARLHGLRAGASHAIPLWPNDPPVFDSLGFLNRAARQF